MFERKYQAANGELLAVFVSPGDGNDVKGGFVKLVFGGPGALCLTPKVAADLGNDLADFTEIVNRESAGPAPTTPVATVTPATATAAASKVTPAPATPAAKPAKPAKPAKRKGRGK